MRPRIGFELLTDCVGAPGAHDQKDLRRAFERTSDHNKTFLREPIHETRMLSPLWLVF